MDQKIELSADTILVKLHGGVTGITRKASWLREFARAATAPLPRLGADLW